MRAFSTAKSRMGGKKMGMARTYLEIAVYVTALFAVILDLP
jgi:hypothetical protein